MILACNKNFFSLFISSFDSIDSLVVTVALGPFPCRVVILITSLVIKLKRLKYQVPESITHFALNVIYIKWNKLLLEIYYPITKISTTTFQFGNRQL